MHSCIPNSNRAMHVQDHSLLTVTALDFATFNTRTIILGHSGVNWSIVELHAVASAYACSMHIVLYQRMTSMHVWGHTSPVRSFMQL